MFNYTPNTEIYTLSLHDALPIFAKKRSPMGIRVGMCVEQDPAQQNNTGDNAQRMVAKEGTLGIFSPPFVEHCLQRSEEHTSELQSRGHLVCRLLLEKKKN